MCLTLVSKTYDPNDYMEAGYKIYLKTKHGFRDIFHGDKIRIEGKYYTEKSNGKIYNNYHESYDTGFHIYSSLQDAKKILTFLPNYDNYCICEVVGWDIRGVGKEGSFELNNFKWVFVSKNIRIVKEL